MMRLALLVALAAAVGLFSQVPVRPVEPARKAVADCPVDVRDLVGMDGDDLTVACHGWTGQDIMGGGDVVVRAARPSPGEPCMDLRYHPVTFVTNPTGVTAMFAFAGGATIGRLPLPPDQVHMIGTEDAYVIDARLGSYEPLLSHQLVCRLVPTYHFYCLDRHAIDRFCFTWVSRPTLGFTATLTCTPISEGRPSGAAFRLLG